MLKLKSKVAFLTVPAVMALAAVSYGSVVGFASANPSPSPTGTAAAAEPAESATAPETAEPNEPALPGGGYADAANVRRYAARRRPLGAQLHRRTKCEICSTLLTIQQGGHSSGTVVMNDRVRIRGKRRTSAGICSFQEGRWNGNGWGLTVQNSNVERAIPNITINICC